MLISKKNIMILLFVFFTFSLHTEEKDLSINVGHLGVGYFYQEDNSSGFFYGNLLNFIYSSDMGIGLNISPFSFSKEMKDGSSNTYTFLNITIFYDLMQDEYVVMAPFATIQTLRPDKLDFFDIKTGFNFSIREKDDKSILCFNYVDIEVGYKYTNNGSIQFYTQIGIDAIGVLALFGFGKDKELNDYKQRHEILSF